MKAFGPRNDGGGADIILGIQWGDEGKGRVVDFYADEYDVVARFGGGDNAGHTLVVGDQKLALRIVPSGVMHSRPALFIGGGTVVSLSGLVAELQMLAGIGVDVSRIAISDRAHIVFPYHAALDRASERARGGEAIGTTGRGIGPAYADRVTRAGITFAELRDPNRLIEKVRHNLRAHATGLADLDDPPNEAEVVTQTRACAERIRPHVVDGVAYIHRALETGKRILIEGAQGTLLDVGFGTYPFVTSSHTIAGGACTGLGIGPTTIRRVTGVAKAYCTRVGAGPFPSELVDATGDTLRERGAEFGTVTGRPRRCGWFDAVAGRYAVRLNGLSDIVITKLDVLTGFERIGVVGGYRVGAHEAGVEAIDDPRTEPILEWHPGWEQQLDNARRIADLPPNAQRYVARLQEILGVRAAAVSVGPERSALALP